MFAPAREQVVLALLLQKPYVWVSNEEIEAIQEVIAKRLGYRLVDHRLELYAVPLKPEDKP